VPSNLRHLPLPCEMSDKMASEKPSEPAAAYEAERLEDDGGPQVDAVEEVLAGMSPQAITIRIGPVFDNGKKRGEPGVWVEYQESYRRCLPAGPVLLTPALWEELANAVDERLSRNGECTRIDKLVKAVRAVHRKYKDSRTEAAALRKENTALRNELRRCQAGLEMQAALVKVAEDVIRMERGS
jgi:hypothetical protein